MKLSTGKVAFKIEFDNGDKDAIYFNPNDPDLMVRMRNLQKNIMNKTKEISDIEVSEDGVPVNGDYMEAFEKVQNIFKEELDYAFGGEVSSVVFKHCSPFAVVNGEYFISQFIEAITPEIKKQIEKSQKAANQKIEKHIGKYR